jgi:hypothetical protein
MEINNIFYGIILYIIIIVSLVLSKPEFIYDYDKSKYKEFGTTNDKTIFTLPVIAICVAILIAVCFSAISPKPDKKDTVQTIQYIHIPYYPQNYQMIPLTTMSMSSISSPTVTQNQSVTK